MERCLAPGLGSSYQATGTTTLRGAFSTPATPPAPRPVPGRTADPSWTWGPKGPRGGLSLQRSREPQRSKPKAPHPLRALPSPPRAGSARLRGLARAPWPPEREQQKAGARVPPAIPRCFALSLIFSPAGPPGRAGRLFPLSCGYRLGHLHLLQDSPPPLATGRQGRGRGREVKGRTVTSPEGAGLGSVPPGWAFPSTPGTSWFPVWVWPPGEGIGLAAGRSCEWIRCEQGSCSSKWVKTLNLRGTFGSLARRRGSSC